MGYPYNGIRISNKKEWTCHVVDDMDEFKNNDAG